MESIITFIILSFIIMCFTFVNGFHDGCNAVATMIASRTMKPTKAITLAVVIEFIAPFATLFFGASVAGTIQKIVKETSYLPASGASLSEAEIKIVLSFVAAGIIAAIFWNLATWWLGLPASSSHALIGGVLGSGLAAYGFSAIEWHNFLIKVVLMIFLTPVVGFVVGYLIMSLIKFLVMRSSPGINQFFKHSQSINMSFLAFNHSLNDTQKSMGIIMLLINAMELTNFNPYALNQFLILHHVPISVSAPPVWAIFGTALALSMGIALGGFRIIKTVGTGIYRVKPIHSFTSQLTSGLVIFTSSLIGAPVSASQIVASSIMGVGSSERVNAVRWGVVKKIMFSWIFTIPAVAVISAIFYRLFLFIF